MTLTTDRLYYENADLLSFTAKVLSHETFDARASVLLDRSAFYPESGGQMADQGALGGIRVVDVQVDEEGRVHHFLEGERPAIGAEVEGEIDQARRKSHRALHTGQHMLSRALLTVLKGETVSSRLGENDCNIDLNLAQAKDGALAKAEDLVNSVIDDDIVVRSYFPSVEALAAMDLRRTPKVQENIRVVEVEGFDLTPCGGTHCSRTGQIGLLRILRTERVKGRLRVLFSAGPRVRKQLFAEQKALTELAHSFTCGALEVGEAVERLRTERKALKKQLGVTRGKLAEATADELLRAAEAEGASEVIAAFEGADAAFLKVVAERLTRGPRAALLAAPSAEGTFVMLARGEGSEVDCGALLKAAAAKAGGKGGGKPSLAQGRLPGHVDWPALIASLDR